MFFYFLNNIRTKGIKAQKQDSINLICYHASSTYFWPIKMILFFYLLFLTKNYKLSAFYASQILVFTILQYLIKQQAKMIAKKSILLLPFILAVILLQGKAQTFQDRLLTQTCCSTCPQSSVQSNQFTATKFQSIVLSAIEYGATTNQFLSSLSKFPFIYTKILLQQIADLDAKVQNGLASCGGVDPDGNYYSVASNTTIQFFFETVIGVIEANAPSHSQNYVNTLVNFVSQIKSDYDAQSLQASDTDSPIYFADNSVLTQDIVNTFAMTNIALFMTTFTRQEEYFMLSCLNSYKSRFSSLSAQNAILNNQLSQLSYPFFEWTTLSLPTNQIQALNSTTKFFTDNPNMNNTNCPITSKIDQFLPGNRRLTDASSDNVDVNVWFERRGDDDPSIYSSIYADLFINLDFNGQVYVPPGEDLSTMPNNGFALGETADSIWATISSQVLRPILYCKMSGLLSGLQSSCPATCDRTC